MDEFPRGFPAPLVLVRFYILCLAFISFFLYLWYVTQLLVAFDVGVLCALSYFIISHLAYL